MSVHAMPPHLPAIKQPGNLGRHKLARSFLLFLSHSHSGGLVMRRPRWAQTGGKQRGCGVAVLKACMHVLGEGYSCTRSGRAQSIHGQKRQGHAGRADAQTRAATGEGARGGRACGRSGGSARGEGPGRSPHGCPSPTTLALAAAASPHSAEDHSGSQNREPGVSRAYAGLVIEPLHPGSFTGNPLGSAPAIEPCAPPERPAIALQAPGGSSGAPHAAPFRSRLACWELQGKLTGAKGESGIRADESSPCPKGKNEQCCYNMERLSAAGPTCDFLLGPPAS